MSLEERDATPDDFPLFARAQRELGIGAPSDPSMWRDRGHRRSFFLLDDSGAEVAYGMCSPYGTRGDVRQVVVYEPYRGRGFGRRVMEAMARRLRGAGCKTWSLEVLESNRPAVALYRAMGMTPTHRIDTFTFASRSDVVAGALADEAEYAGLEGLFDLLPGKLADFGARPGARVLVAPDRRGVAVAHASRRLIWPLWGAELGAALELLRRAIAACDPGEVDVQAEGEIAIAAARAEGGVLKEQAIAMRGPIPLAPLQSRSG